MCRSRAGSEGRRDSHGLLRWRRYVGRTCNALVVEKDIGPIRPIGPIAFVFPGQGSQHPGMGKDLAEKFPAARQVFEEADRELGFALSELCFNGPAEQLQLTENTQPAILTVSIAALRAMETEGFPKPDFVAGHSLGEYSALVAAGSLSLTEAVKTVRARGRFMQEAVPVGVGAMAAILGADLNVVNDACKEAAQGQ